MGWLYGWADKQSLIDHLSETQENDSRKWEMLKHTVRGNTYWGVVQITKKSEGVIVKHIICCRLSSSGEKNDPYRWGYKDMDESMGPCYYDCPLSYLDIVNEENADWRQKVREYHARKSQIRNRKIEVGKTYELIGCSIPHITICSVKPLRGHYNGIRYRLHKTRIGDELHYIDFKWVKADSLIVTKPGESLIEKVYSNE